MMATGHPTTTHRSPTRTPSTAPYRAAATILLGALLLLATGPAAAGVGGADSTVRLGRTAGAGLVAAGFVAQGAGLALNVASFGVSGLIGPRMFVHLGTIPFAPLSVAGFEALAYDGTHSSRLRGISNGLLEGALYAGVSAGLDLVHMAVHDHQCSVARAQDEDACFEDFTNAFLFAYALPHGVVALGMLIPGIIVRAVADSGARVATLPVTVQPVAGLGYTGFAIHGRF